MRDHPKIWRALSAKLNSARNIREILPPEPGVLLCTRKNHELVEYALAGMSNNLFVSRYQVHAGQGRDGGLPAQGGGGVGGRG